MYSCVAGILARAWVTPGPTCSSPRGVRRCGSGLTLSGRPWGAVVLCKRTAVMAPTWQGRGDRSGRQQRRMFNTGPRWNEGWRAGR